jgi:ribosome maturation factor RimP
MSTLEQKLEALIAPQVRVLGYELVDLEYQARSPSGGPLLRLFIDFPEGSEAKHIGLEDCIAVDKGLDPLFESTEFDTLNVSGFTLEVSSPGLDRPLKKISDYQKHKGKNVVVRTFRPPTEEEYGNPDYFKHHQKQKNFLGRLLDVRGDKIVMEIDNASFEIPLALISKAHVDGSSEVVVDE